MTNARAIFVALTPTRILRNLSWSAIENPVTWEWPQKIFWAIFQTAETALR